MQTKNKTKNAQILLITLLVLTIIGIVIVGLVLLINRDVTQVVSTEKYELVYNSAESEIRKLIDVVGDYSVTLDNISNEFVECNPVQVNVEYKCIIQNNDTGLNIRTDVTVKNQKDVENYEVFKDRPFYVTLNGYNNIIDVDWDRDVAIEFTLIIRDAGSNYKVIKDVYDLAGVYDSLISDNPNNDVSNIHPFAFVINNPGNVNYSTRFNIGATSGLQAGDTPVYLSIIPRTKNSFESIKLNIRAFDSGSFPYQIRDFSASSFDEDDNSSPVANVVSQIPLAPQFESIFDYAFLSEGAVSPF